MSKLYIIITFFIIIYYVNSSYYIKLDDSMEEELDSYITMNRKGKLFPNITFIKSEKPKISIIISIYNEQKNILSTIRSIQNQNLQDIEIVCINDNSKDNTSSILNKLAEEDPRIKIITNRNNHGVLYNRLYGTIESKGEYVAFINSGDQLCNKEILKKCYDLLTKKYNRNIDIISYKASESSITENGYIEKYLFFENLIPNNFNTIIGQPEIRDYYKKSSNKTGPHIIFDKIFKKELIVNVSDYIGQNIWNQKIFYFDDFLLAYGIFRMAKSIVNIEDIGYFHLIEINENNNFDDYKEKNPEKPIKKIRDFVLITERLFELTEKEPESLGMREFILRKLEEDKFMRAITTSIYYKKFLSICEKFIKWKYIDKPTKERTSKFMKYLLRIKLDPNKIKRVNKEDNDEDDDDDDEEDDDGRSYDL